MAKKSGANIVVQKLNISALIRNELTKNIDARPQQVADALLARMPNNKELAEAVRKPTFQTTHSAQRKKLKGGGASPMLHTSKSKGVMDVQHALDKLTMWNEKGLDLEAVKKAVTAVEKYKSDQPTDGCSLGGVLAFLALLDGEAERLKVRQQQLVGLGLISKK